MFAISFREKSIQAAPAFFNTIPTFSRTTPTFFNSITTFSNTKLVFSNTKPTFSNTKLSFQNNNIMSIVIEGNTVFSDTQLQSVVTDFVGKPISLDNIQQISIAISSFYQQQGYTSSEAYPKSPQNLQQGEVQIVVVEGYLEAVEIKGLSSLKESYIKNRLSGADEVLNTKQLASQLKQIESNPLIKSIEAELKQGNKPHSSILSLVVRENPNFNLSFGIDNYGALSSGEIQGNTVFTINNVTGNGDRFITQFIASEGSKQIIADYLYPLNPLNSVVIFHYEAGKSQIIEEPFRRFDIEGDYQKAFIQWRQPVIKTLTDELVFSTEIGWLSSKSFLDDQPFSFFADIPNSGYHSYTFRLAGEYYKSLLKSAFALRTELTLGFDSIDTTNDPFIIIRGQAQYIKSFSEDWLLSLSVSGQLTSMSLGRTEFGILPSEQFSLGGINTVPGYSLNFRRGDHGINAKGELFYTIVDRPDWGELTLKPFVAIGTISNEQGILLEPHTLASIGLNVNWNYLGWQTNLGVAHPLIQDNVPSNFQQEFYFSVQKTFSF